jgi:hypothetical protein
LRRLCKKEDDEDPELLEDVEEGGEELEEEEPEEEEPEEEEPEEEEPEEEEPEEEEPPVEVEDDGGAPRKSTGSV